VALVVLATLLVIGPTNPVDPVGAAAQAASGPPPTATIAPEGTTATTAPSGPDATAPPTTPPGTATPIDDVDSRPPAFLFIGLVVSLLCAAAVLVLILRTRARSMPT